MSLDESEIRVILEENYNLKILKVSKIPSLEDVLYYVEDINCNKYKLRLQVASSTKKIAGKVQISEWLFYLQNNLQLPLPVPIKTIKKEVTCTIRSSNYVGVLNRGYVFYFRTARVEHAYVYEA